MFLDRGCLPDADDSLNNGIKKQASQAAPVSSLVSHPSSPKETQSIMPSLPSTYLSLLAFLLFSLPTLIFSIPLSNAILPTPQDPDNDTQNLTMSNSNCAPATTDQWTVPNWLVEDCFAAINNFYLKKIYNSNPSQPQEFLALKTPPQTSKAPVYTPAKLSTGMFL